jgi:hypothetical protein
MRACVRAARAVQARVEALEEALERLREECGFRTKEAAQLRMQVRDRVVWLVPSETGVTSRARSTSLSQNGHAERGAADAQRGARR